MKINSYITDEKLETDGVWRNLKEGGRVLVGRYKSNTYNAALREQLKPIIAKLTDDKEIDPDQFTDAVLVASANTILLGWDDIQDDDGNELEHTTELGLHYLRVAKDFREEVLGLSQQREAYSKAFQEHATGN